jgi:hypothetical protein
MSPEGGIFYIRQTFLTSVLLRVNSLMTSVPKGDFFL